jgi:hypothetical protein
MTAKGGKAMTHLFVELYDRVGDRFPCCTLDDHEVGNRQYFHDLRPHGSADLADRIVIRPGDEYRAGDHIRLLDEATTSNTDTVAIDPAIVTDVDLNEILFDKRGFADRAAAVLIVTNPHRDSRYRLRVTLFDQADQKYPSLVFYDWEYPRGFRQADLNLFHFANRTAFIRIEPGPAYRPGDRVVLRESLAQGTRSLALEPGEYDLGQLMVLEQTTDAWSFIREHKYWAETVTALELDLKPRVIKH